MAREYSFEVYAPASDEVRGGRVAYGDHYCTRCDAVAAMVEAMQAEPDGTTAIVYPRSRDGDILLPVFDYTKKAGEVQRSRA